MGIGDVLRGNDGDDRIYGSSEGNEDSDFGDGVFQGDQIDGGAGNDLIWSFGGADLSKPVRATTGFTQDPPRTALTRMKATIRST